MSILRTLAMLACAVVFSCAARAGGLQAVAALAPADADVIVLINGASDMRRGDAQAVLDAVLPFLQLTNTSKRWEEFAAELDWTPDKAFDKLLGQRVALIGDNIWSNDRAFALITEVDRRTANHLRTELPIAPRKLVAGKAVMAIEKGALELISARHQWGSLLLIGPSEDALLLDKLAGTLGEDVPDAFSTSPAFKRIIQAAPREQAHALFFVRLPDPVGGWVGGVVFARDQWVTVSAIVQPHKKLPAINAWSPEDWSPMKRGALAFALEVRPSDLDDPAEFGLPEGILSDMLWLAPSDELRPVLGDLHAASLTEDERGALTITTAVSVKNVNEAAAPIDAMMADFVTDVNIQRGGAAWSHDFGGFLPEATRHAPIKAAPGVWALSLWQSSGEFAWTFRQSPHPQDAPAGWFIAGTEPERVKTIAAAFAQDAPKHERPPGKYLSIGAAHPAELARVLQREQVSPIVLAMMRLFSEVGWYIQAPSTTEAHGKFYLQLAEPK